MIWKFLLFVCLALIVCLQFSSAADLRFRRDVSDEDEDNEINKSLDFSKLLDTVKEANLQMLVIMKTTLRDLSADAKNIFYSAGQDRFIPDLPEILAKAQ